MTEISFFVVEKRDGQGYAATADFFNALTVPMRALLRGVLSLRNCGGGLCPIWRWSKTG